MLVKTSARHRRPRAAGAVLSACLLVLLAAASALAAPARGGAVRELGSAASGSTVSLVLPLRADLAGLERFATAVSTPGSPQYGDYEPVAALARRYGASARARAQVLGVLRRARATGVRVDVTGLFVDATMTVGRADRLFGAPLADFRSAMASRYIAPVAQPEVPASLQPAVTGVVGLNTEPIAPAVPAPAASSPGTAWTRRPAVSVRAAMDAGSGYARRTGTPRGCGAAVGQSGFTPNQYLTAYGYAPLQSSGLSGQGERVALIEIDGFRYADLRRFASCFSLGVPAINGYGVGLRHPLAPGGESTLDLEVLDAAAPRLRAIDVYESQPSAPDVLRSLTAPLENRSSLPNVISASLGACEATTVQAIGKSGLRAVEGSLALAAATGISVLASSGDQGSSDCLGQSGNPLPGLAVSFPASSPWVTGVGGTNVTLNAANQIVGQQVWNDQPFVAAAGGGGVSAAFSRPNYQNTFTTTRDRVVPDVSMLADILPGYEIYCTAGPCISKEHPNPWTQVGGTSASAPLLAGGLAIVDQALREHGRQDIGLANPLLYKIDRLPIGPSVISDVTANNNDLGQSVIGRPFGCCSAAPGFDKASGLGSVNVAALAPAAEAIVPALVTVRLSLPAQRHPLSSRVLTARVSCSGRCLLGAYTRIKIGGRRRLLTRQSRAYLLRRAGRTTVRIVLSAATVRSLREALARHERVTATIYGVILDPSGAVEAQTRGAVLRIAR